MFEGAEGGRGGIPDLSVYLSARTPYIPDHRITYILNPNLPHHTNTMQKNTVPHYRPHRNCQNRIWGRMKGISGLGESLQEVQ